MSTTSHKPSTGRGFISGFRSGIRFSERLAKNCSIQFKWWFKSQNDHCRSVRSWRVRKCYDYTFVEYLLKFLIVIIYLLLILPLLLLWALLKSI